MSKKIYFASDFHLGLDSQTTSKEREKQIVRWFSSIQHDAEAIYLVGDIFDYWFEYGSSIPKGYSRFLGKLAELKDNGIAIFFFTGNHDMWMFDYFPEELGIPIFRKVKNETLQGKKIQIAHGDGLGPGDWGYKFIKKVFGNSLCQWAFARLHPNLALYLMKTLSQGRSENKYIDEVFHGREKEMLIQHAEEQLQIDDTIDYFVFGHRHLPLDVKLSNGKSHYFGLGDWISYQSYGVLYNGVFTLEYFEKENKTLIVHD